MGLTVVVCGSRSFPDPFRVSLAIDAYIAGLPPGSTVIHGGAQGADTMADAAGARYGHTVSVYPADWKKHGKRAGVLRNLQMLDAQPDEVAAFWDGKSSGTGHMIRSARGRSIPTKVVVA